ncbi:hypothetical protein LPJ66_002558 [Kickxella alabastrina]|uniref:Uncharacterized protein n=1 Tax=Kickxella alabastrina TaxID=61397 RepID=A0ACC1IQ58_9FUNG|nr:hypothetical protein LPJ66_002558 [Kickxella alabastrina]
MILDSQPQIPPYDPNIYAPDQLVITENPAFAKPGPTYIPPPRPSPVYPTPYGVGLPHTIPYIFRPVYTAPVLETPVYTTPYAVESAYTTPYSEKAVYTTPYIAEPEYTTPYIEVAVYTTPYFQTFGYTTPYSKTTAYTTPYAADTLVYTTLYPTTPVYTTPYPETSVYAASYTVKSAYGTPYTDKLSCTTPYTDKPAYTSPYTIDPTYTNVDHSSKCTWDGIQVNDPETWDPVPSYQYSKMPHDIPRPGAIDSNITALVSKLTLKQKIGQMTQIQVGQLIDCNGELNTTAVKYWIHEWNVGSFLETPANHRGKCNWYSPNAFGQITDAVQKTAIEHGSRIPVIWGLDSVRGANYVKGAVIFPAGISTAATFNPKRAYDAGRILAKDTRAVGVHWAFAPVSDIPVNNLWSRVYENFGEDPFLSSHMTAASVNGYQGNYKRDRSRVAACMKHFIGYGYPFDGSDRANRHIAAHELLEYFVPPFKAAVNAGVATAMESYGVINGEPVVMSQFYLQKLLRKYIGFEGMLVTDWEEINGQATTYHTAKDVKQATWATLNRTSVDMSMVTDNQSFSQTTYNLVVSGAIPECRIDEPVARILQLKKDLGLFETPFADPNLQATAGSAQDIEAARNSVRESVTLLKNKRGVLPLRHTDRVLFVGPTLNSTRYMGGGWNVHWQGPSDKESDEVYQGFGDTILKGVQRVTGHEPQYFEGVDIKGSELINISAVIAAAKKADKIVIGLGEGTYAEIDGNIDSMKLPQNQLELVYAIATATEKPIVAVLVEGRPRLLERVAGIADGIVQAYLPGTYGGLPIAEILYGKVNPSGRLPYTYPATEAQASTTIWQPSYTDYKPQWAFGYGLSYSHVEYTNVTVSCSTLTLDKPITISVSITNHGPYPQKETVLLFTNQPYRFDMAPEHYRMRHFTKVSLAVGETKNVTFELRAEDLAFWSTGLEQKIVSSPVNLAINPHVQQNIKVEITLDVNVDNSFMLARV